jgi:hypothetical protein
VTDYAKMLQVLQNLFEEGKNAKNRQWTSPVKVARAT